MDYTKTCWYCGKNTMFSYNSWYVCENCGATWNEVLKGEPSPIARGSVEWIGENKKKHKESAFKPSKSLVRKVAKIKGGK